MPARKQTQPRTCQSCGGSFDRMRMSTGRLEGYAHFMERKFCSLSCAAKGRPSRRVPAADARDCTRCGQHKPMDAFARSTKGWNGHAAVCRDCQRLWREANKAEIAAGNRARYEKDKDRHLKRSEAYRQSNRDRLLKRSREKYAEGPDRYWRRGYMQRARRLGLVNPKIDDFTRGDVVARYGDACFYCDSGMFEQIDHYMPICLGGDHTLENVRPCCDKCNRSKGRKHPSTIRIGR